ncbi:MAG TPA: TetR family transcriptional regulator [Lacipirellulaceae bacterium]|jgi:TetR/AcrR family transcriptional regulator|nr:TetR family transcriptional regulator [Lacipirellulaceae bacterium]
MADERIRDSECTRNAVLCAAERLFAEQGFAATSMRDISQASGVSHPLIHHHFGSKNDLYSAVKRRLVEDYARRFPNAAKAANRPLNVRAEMRRIMKYIGGNPMMLRLAARTRLEGDHQVWPGEPAVLDMLTRRIAVSQQRNLVRKDISPEHVSIMLLGLVYFWLDSREHFVRRFGDRVNDVDYLRQTIAILERGIAPTDARKTTVRQRQDST